jgi:hypothetical protein
MRPDQKARAAAALERAHGILAGDSVIAVDEDDVQTALTCMAVDLDKSEAGGEGGLEIDASGLRFNKLKRLTFLKRELADKGLSMADIRYFLIGNERWDFAEDWPARDSIVPLAGIHNMIEVIVRLAVERNRSIPGAEFGYAE